MKKIAQFQSLRFVLAAGVLAFASVVPALVTGSVSANTDYELMTNREVRMSSSAVSATDVTYLIRATTPSTQTLASMVIEFCSNTPIIGDACTAPAGFDINEAGLVLANQTGITDWQIDAATDANTLVLTRTGGAASFTAGLFTLELGAGGGSDGITNPSGLGSFYARFVNFEANAGAQQYAPANIDNSGANTVHHGGGAAMSTASQITVQAKVQERLTFCVYTSAVNYADCTVSTTNPVVLGDANGVLDPSNEYVSKATKYNVTTNAASGVTIRAKGATLASNGNTIDAIGATPAVSNPGNEQFGFCTYRDTGGGAAGLTPNAKYNGDVGGGVDCEDTTQGINGDGGADFAFDLTTACGSTAAAADFGENNLSCLYGDAIASKTAGNFSTGIVSFVGNISNTTEPGIYTTTMTFVATGNY